MNSPTLRLGAAIVLAMIAGIAITAAPARAAGAQDLSRIVAPRLAEGLRCSTHWHFITHGETGLNVRPDPTQYQGSTDLRADAVPGTDWWNQAFLFCRDPAWQAGAYTIWSNLTSAWWSVDFQNNVYAGWTGDLTRTEEFDVWRYDSTWWVIQSLSIANVFNPIVAPDRSLPQNNNRLLVTAWPLNGNDLFKITPTDLLG